MMVSEGKRGAIRWPRYRASAWVSEGGCLKSFPGVEPPRVLCFFAGECEYNSKGQW